MDEPLAGLNYSTAQRSARTSERPTGVTEARDRRGRRSAPLDRGAHFRGDIEGLRAVAVVLVLLWHAGVPVVRGGYVGVDVFFVISGFLITGRLLRQLRESDRISLFSFYAARAQRLLPNATLTLYAVLVLLFLFLPDIRWQETTWDVVAAALYVVNWRLADRSVDYLASEHAPSAVQHFWSLSVEEQFYVVWPLLIIAGAVVARFLHGQRSLSGRPGRDLRRTLLVLLGVLGLASLGWSAYLTATDPGPAYFVTTTRVWELAIGALLAVYDGRWPRFDARTGRVVGWIGGGAILAAGLLFSTGTPYPGVAALLPTLGTAAVIAAGTSVGRIGVARLLDTGPMRTVGALSYSLYLWHWPLIVVFTAQAGGALSVPAAVGATLLSVVPAYLAYRFVETPVRRHRLLTRSRANTLVAVTACATVTVATGLLLGSVQRQEPPAALPDSPHIGAMLLAADPRGDVTAAAVDRVDKFVPAPIAARTDFPPIDKDGCFADQRVVDLKSCAYGDAGSAYTVMLVGDSHAAQWATALKPIAETRHWRLRTFTKSACPYVTVPIAVQGTDRTYAECSAWNDRLHELLLGPEKPKLVIMTSADFNVVHGGKAVTGAPGGAAKAAAMHAVAQELTAAGVTVVFIRDNPHAPFDVADCVSANTEKLTKCAFPRDAALYGVGGDQVNAATGVAGAHVVDLDDAICPVDPCSAVIGGVLVYRDQHHMTATYVRSLTPRLDAALAAIVAPASATKS